MVPLLKRSRAEIRKASVYKDINRKKGGVMFRLVLASHGRLAEGMKNSAQIIVGKSIEIFTICAYVDERVTLESQIDELFDSFIESDEIIVITDIFGGSVNNEFVQRLPNRRFWLVSGMSLPLVIQMAMIDENDSIQEKIKEALETGKEMICFCNPMVENASKEKEDF